MTDAFPKIKELGLEIMHYSEPDPHFAHSVSAEQLEALLANSVTIEGEFKEYGGGWCWLSVPQGKYMTRIFRACITTSKPDTAEGLLREWLDWMGTSEMPNSDLKSRIKRLLGEK